MERAEKLKMDFGIEDIEAYAEQDGPKALKWRYIRSLLQEVE